MTDHLKTIAILTGMLGITFLTAFYPMVTAGAVGVTFVVVLYLIVLGAVRGG